MEHQKLWIRLRRINHAGGVGAVLRYYQGNFLAASCKFLPHIPSATMVEAIAMRDGLALTNATG
jgi:hypothetical protein